MIIFGFPTETVEEAKETIRFIEKHQDIIHSSIFFRFVLLEHSYIVENPEEFALQSVTEDSNIFSSNREFTTSEGMEKRALSEFLHWAQQYRKKELYGHPFWYYLRIREYLLLYTARFGVQEIRNWKVDPRDLSLCATPQKRPAI
jgi:hypothetical protein